MRDHAREAMDLARGKTRKDLDEERVLRAYPNNRVYCGRLRRPMPALSAPNVLNVA
jgi:hypothetical protein